MGLPKINTREWADEVKFFVDSNQSDRIKRAKKYNMLAASYERRMRERGIHAGVKEHTVVVENDIPPERIPYPDLKIKPFKPVKSSRDEEDLALIISDPHIDKVTESYNLEVARDRFDYLLDGTMTIINLHRPIRKVHIFMLGDIVQGENAFQGSKVGETLKGVYEQIHDDAVPILSRFVTSLAQGVKEIDVYGVRGNHGRYAKEAPDKTNWDSFFYKALAGAMVNQKGINVYLSKEFYQLVNIRGFRFFTIHGDQVSARMGIPLFAMRRKMQEWFAYVGGFNYGYAGHFHTEAKDQVNSVADYTICPPLVTGDSWELEKIGRASEPKQICFGIHDRNGRSFNYQLHTDEKFLPKKYDEPEGVVRV